MRLHCWQQTLLMHNCWLCAFVLNRESGIHWLGCYIAVTGCLHRHPKFLWIKSQKRIKRQDWWHILFLREGFEIMGFTHTTCTHTTHTWNLAVADSKNCYLYLSLYIQPWLALNGPSSYLLYSVWSSVWLVSVNCKVLGSGITHPVHCQYITQPTKW